jgi:hypothetical protein
MIGGDQMAKTTEEHQQREANVVLELRCQDPVSEEVLDANSDDVLEAVEQHAADIALGPAIAVNEHENAIKLRFDLIASTAAEVHQQISAVMAVIERETDLVFRSARSAYESSDDDAESKTAEFAACP